MAVLTSSIIESAADFLLLDMDYLLFLFRCFWYTVVMTIQQTIEIPADRKVHFDVVLPDYVPRGQTQVV
jgi:hypothetical protein